MIVIFLLLGIVGGYLAITGAAGGGAVEVIVGALLIAFCLALMMLDRYWKRREK